MPSFKWVLDPTHSEVTFQIKHLMISNITGQFTKFEINVETQDEDFTTAKANLAVDVNSVTTGNEQRDGHLRTDDFFNAAQFPQIKFVATKYEAVDNDGSYELYGYLTIREITKPVKLDVEFGGVITDPWGSSRAGFSVNGKINRKDFGLRWHAVTETGGLVASDEVSIHCNLELIKQV